VLEGKAAAPSAANVREEDFAEAAAGEGEDKKGPRRAPARKAPPRKPQAKAE
jgi:small subunit ribosomal protein S2